jgi:Fe-S-cluster containining protein
VLAVRPPTRDGPPTRPVLVVRSPGLFARSTTGPNMEGFNPCISCGICCTHFRISFYWAEADDAPGGFVPAHMTEKLNHTMRCMKGSNELPRRCAALAGTVGEQVACTIYANRPTPCREFPVYFDDGTPNPRCDELRATIGLPPLPHSPLPQAPLPRAA